MKKTRLSLLTCLILILCLLFTSCASSNAIVGSWQTALDISDKVQESIGENVQLPLDEFVLPLVYTFRDDGIYEISVDQESYNRTFSVIRQAMSDNLYSLTESLIGMTGTSMTVEEYYSLSNSSFEATVDEMCHGLASFPEQFAQKGVYTVTDDTLCLTPEGKSGDDSRYEGYQLNGNELTLLGDSAQANTQELPYPLVLTRK